MTIWSKFSVKYLNATLLDNIKKILTESGKLMSITLEPLHGFVCGFRRLKVCFIIDSDNPISNNNNVGFELKKTKRKLTCDEI